MDFLNENVFFVKTKNEKVKIPFKATRGSAGFDIYAEIDSDITINPGDLVKIPTGISISLPSPEFVALLFSRSGLAVNYGIALSNGVGVIDSDYRGEIVVGLCNLGKKSYTIKTHERIAQMIIMPYFAPGIVEVASLSDTERGAGGFGSTGK